MSTLFKASHSHQISWRPFFSSCLLEAFAFHHKLNEWRSYQSATQVIFLFGNSLHWFWWLQALKTRKLHDVYLTIYPSSFSISKHTISQSQYDGVYRSKLPDYRLFVWCVQICSYDVCHYSILRIITIAAYTFAKEQPFQKMVFLSRNRSVTQMRRLYGTYSIHITLFFGILVETDHNSSCR